MEDKLSIRVNVAERLYPLKIDRSDEERIRKAARMINERVLQYKQLYTDKDAQDFLAMAALQFVIKLLESENRFEISPLIDELNGLDEWLEDYIEKSGIRSLK